MFHLVAVWHAIETDQRRHLRVVAGKPPDHAAERAPIAQLPWRERHFDQQSRLPLFIKMETIARRAPGQSRAQGRWTAFEVRSRAANAVGIDDDAGIAIGHML